MATDSPKNTLSSSDDDSVDEDGSSGRRRRFCIERIPDAPSSEVKVPAKRERSSQDYDGSGYSRNTSKRRMTEVPAYMTPRHDHRVIYPKPLPHHRHQHEHQYQPPYQSPHIPHAQPHSHQYQQQHLQQHRPHHHHHHHHHQLQHQQQQQQQQQQQHQQQPQHQPHHLHQHEPQQPHHHPKQIHREPQTREVGCIDARLNSVARKPVRNREPPGPTVFINPKMIKKFIGKSLELASSSASNQSTNASKSLAKGNYHEVKNPSSLPTTSSAPNPTDTIDLKTSSKESLQAASTMAIIRLVTECIRNDNKRDEKLNKILVARLIEQLTKHERENDDHGGSSSPEEASHNKYGEGTMNYVPSEERYMGVSHHQSHHYELGAGGQPIPVIGGGSIGNRYNSPSSSSNSRGSSQYPPAKHQQQGGQYQHRPRHVSSDRRDSRHLENQTNKLRNYSR